MTENGKVEAPPSFRTHDRDWTIILTVGLTDRVRDATGVDLLADDRTPYLSLLFDNRKLAAVLWTCVACQAEAASVEREAFLESLDGDALTAGWGALAEAIVFFSQKPLREAVKTDIELKIEAMEKGVLAMAEIATSEEAETAIQAALNQLKGELQADLPRAFADSVSS